MRKHIFCCCLLFLLVITNASAKIVFAQKGVYVIDDDGTNVTLLTDQLNARAPKWSPDGKQIIFTRGKHFQNAYISIMNADGTDIQDLTRQRPPEVDSDYHPSFSPDGKSIVFGRTETQDNKEQHSVCVMDLESGKIKKISDLNINTPEFSPDGKHIVFTTVPVLGVSGGAIWMMEDDGADARPLLKPPPPNSPFIISRWNPRWSPDGKWILYTEEHHKLAIIDGATHYIPHGYYYYICDKNGRNIKKLNIPKTLNPAGHDWADNGKAIVFCAHKAVLKVRQEFYKYDIYKFHIASGELTTLHVPQGNAYNLDWIDDDVLSVSPHGKKK